MSDDIAITEQDTALIDSAIELLKADEFAELSELLASQEPAEIAHLLESLPDIRRSSLWSQVPDEFKGPLV